MLSEKEVLMARIGDYDEVTGRAGRASSANEGPTNGPTRGTGSGKGKGGRGKYKVPEIQIKGEEPKKEFKIIEVGTEVDHARKTRKFTHFETTYRKYTDE
jgi:hypothetical protein